jgi:hypothetical protein
VAYTGFGGESHRELKSCLASKFRADGLNHPPALSLLLVVPIYWLQFVKTVCTPISVLSFRIVSPFGTFAKAIPTP